MNALATLLSTFMVEDMSCGAECERGNSADHSGIIEFSAIYCAIQMMYNIGVCSGDVICQ